MLIIPAERRDGLFSFNRPIKDGGTDTPQPFRVEWEEMEQLTGGGLSRQRVAPSELAAFVTRTRPHVEIWPKGVDGGTRTSP